MRKVYQYLGICTHAPAPRSITHNTLEHEPCYMNMAILLLTSSCLFALSPSDQPSLLPAVVGADLLREAAARGAASRGNIALLKWLHDVINYRWAFFFCAYASCARMWAKICLNWHTHFAYITPLEKGASLLPIVMCLMSGCAMVFESMCVCVCMHVYMNIISS